MSMFRTLKQCEYVSTNTVSLVGVIFLLCLIFLDVFVIYLHFGTMKVLTICFIFSVQ